VASRGLRPVNARSNITSGLSPANTIAGAPEDHHVFVEVRGDHRNGALEEAGGISWCPAAELLAQEPMAMSEGGGRKRNHLPFLVDTEDAGFAFSMAAACF